MKICIRADGGNTIGLGHVMRTLALAKKIYKHNDVFFVCKIDSIYKDKYKAGIEKIKQEGFRVIEIDQNNIKTDIKQIKADCIITDSYDVDEEYFNIVKEQFKFSGYIDDVNICNYFNVDFLINQNIYGKELNYKTNIDTKLFLGSEYVLLRDEFKNLYAKNRKINENIEKIMITVGGSDDNNITERIIKELCNFGYELYVVIGDGFRNTDNLKQYENNKIKLYFNADMPKLMSECDMAVSSCGSTLYELAFCGTPTVGIIVAENQKLVAITMQRLGIVKCTEIENIKEAIICMNYKVRYEMSNKSTQIIDGKGSERIAEYIETLNRGLV